MPRVCCASQSRSNARRRPFSNTTWCCCKQCCCTVSWALIWFNHFLWSMFRFSLFFFFFKTFKENYKYASASNERCHIHFYQVDELKTQTYKIFSGTDTRTKERLPLFEIDEWGEIHKSVKRRVDGNSRDGNNSFIVSLQFIFHSW